MPDTKLINAREKNESLEINLKERIEETKKLIRQKQGQIANARAQIESLFAEQTQLEKRQYHLKETTARAKQQSVYFSDQRQIKEISNLYENILIYDYTTQLNIERSKIIESKKATYNYLQAIPKLEETNQLLSQKVRMYQELIKEQRTSGQEVDPKEEKIKQIITQMCL